MTRFSLYINRITLSGVFALAASPSWLLGRCCNESAHSTYRLDSAESSWSQMDSSRWLAAKSISRRQVAAFVCAGVLDSGIAAAEIWARARRPDMRSALARGLVVVVVLV